MKNKKDNKLFFTPVVYNGNDVVVQGNDFLESPKNLTLQEYKLFMFLISKINPNGTEFSTFRVTAEEFAKAIGIEMHSDVYRNLQAATKRLMKRVIEIHKPEQELFVQTHLISSTRYWYGKGYVDVVISQDMTPYLIGLQRDFTQYKLSQITRLSSSYAMRIYELLKKQEKLGNRTFFIDDLRKKLNIPSDKMKVFKDFRQSVLEISKREINQKTDIIIDYKLIKTSRKFTAIQFEIIPKNPHKSDRQEIFREYRDIPDSLKDNLTSGLQKLGFSIKASTSLINNSSDKVLENAIAAVKERVALGKCKNPQAMLRTALKEKWIPANSKRTPPHMAGNSVNAQTSKEISPQTLPPKFNVFRFLKSFLKR
jgi:hypothetical protein